MSQFVEYLHEVFQDFGPLTSRKMFGGHGLYHQGLMFGLIADDTLYLKADKDSSAEFEALGLMPFQYQKGDKIVSMSYYQAPESIYDDPEQASAWASLAYKTALRAK